MKWLSPGIQTRSLEILSPVRSCACCGAGGKRGCRRLPSSLQGFAPVTDQQQRSSQRETAVTFVGFGSILFHSVLFCSVLFFSLMFTTTVSNYLPAVSWALSVTCRSLCLSALTDKGSLTTPSIPPYHKVKEIGYICINKTLWRVFLEPVSPSRSWFVNFPTDLPREDLAKWEQRLLSSAQGQESS